MIANRKEFYSGMGMMAIFLIVLGLFFTPIYNGHNGLSYLDNLYNSISKGSANYLEIVNKTAISHFGQTVEVSLSANNTDHAKSEHFMHSTFMAKARYIMQSHAV